MLFTSALPSMNREAEVREGSERQELGGPGSWKGLPKAHCQPPPAGACGLPAAGALTVKAATIIKMRLPRGHHVQRLRLVPSGHSIGLVNAVWSKEDAERERRRERL